MLFEAIQAEFRRLQLHPVNLIDERPGSEMCGEQTCVHDERIKIDAIDYLVYLSGIEEGLSDDEAGRLISHEELITRIKTWRE